MYIFLIKQLSILPILLQHLTLSYLLSQVNQPTVFFFTHTYSHTQIPLSPFFSTLFSFSCSLPIIINNIQMHSSVSSHNTSHCQFSCCAHWYQICVFQTVLVIIHAFHYSLTHQSHCRDAVFTLYSSTLVGRFLDSLITTYSE